MTGSGFRDDQWLIQRDGRFLMVTELLYRLAERCDGSRTPEEIAAGLSASTRWQVSEENVRYLIESKLRPLGLIASADGAEPERHIDRSSALRVNLKRQLIGPWGAERIARIFQFLHRPQILVPLLGAAVAAHGWLYFIHGATASIASVLQRPGWFLVVVAALLAAAVFHEFGHASALRYEGGSVRGMGAGFYFIFPAFYTDVTDSYRLPRAARVRTDLGGPYFHLVFSVLVVTAYLIMRQEFLLLIVVLIDLEVIRQFIPVLRLDGYWLFADLTGIPDPFSLVAPFLRRSPEVRDRTGGEPAPELRSGARRAFLGYLVITMVALPVLLFLTVLHTPRIAELAWAALRERAQGFTDAAARGEVASMAASLVETLLIALQLAGLAAFFYFIAWKPVRGAWRWSRDRPAPVRSLVRGTVLLAAGGFLLIFGALFPWMLVGPLIVDGIDSTAGRISLVCGALLVLAAVLVIAGRRPIVRRIAATLALGLGLAGAWMAGRGLIASQAELGPAIGPTVSYGLVVTMLGAVLALAGGLMATMTTLRARRSVAVNPPS